MSKKTRIPSYRFHKGSGPAVVVLGGKSVYLGKWNSPESRAEYDRVVAEWLAQRRRMAEAVGVDASSGATLLASPLTVNELILAFFQHAEKHYRHADGRPTGELDNLRHALRPVRKLYGRTIAVEFGPLALRAVQEDMVKSGLCRTVVNARVNRVRRAFRWAASVEMIAVAIVQALETVPALRRGRCDARESAGVSPVDWAHVEATLPHLPRPVAAMVELMRYSNCRAEDAVILRGCDLTKKGDVWEYRPASHKNAWREEDSPVHRRVVYLGPRCQEILRSFCKTDPQEYLFSPREARAEYQAQRARKRKSHQLSFALDRTFAWLHATAGR